MRDVQDPTTLLEKSIRGISPVLAVCPASEALITRILVTCGNDAVEAVISVVYY